MPIISARCARVEYPLPPGSTKEVHHLLEIIKANLWFRVYYSYFQGQFIKLHSTFSSPANLGQVFLFGLLGDGPGCQIFTDLE